MSADADLPPLPEYAHAFRPRWDGDLGGFTEQQMQLFRAEGVAAERERLLSALRKLHDEQADRAVWHNYYLYAANVLAGKIFSEGEAPSTTRLVTLDQAEAMVAAERERIRLLVEAVRDANAASQDADDCLIYTPAVERAWVALLVGLDGPTAPGPAP